MRKSDPARKKRWPRHAQCVVLGWMLSQAGSESLHAGTIFVPTDISVRLTAKPSSHLHSGQRIDFTLSVTNNGPESATLVDVESSLIYDELNLNTAMADCEDLGLIDLDDSFYYVYNWNPTHGSPLAVGETRYCHLNLEFTEWAPDTFSLTFSVPYWLLDTDPTNNAATVTLRRETQGIAATPVPAASPLALAVLAAWLAVLARVAQPARSMGRTGRRAQGQWPA